jgi:hypothetical protein
MHNPEKFRLFYNQTIQPELRRLDKYRLRLLRVMFFSALIMAGVGALLMYLDVLVIALLAMIPFGIYISYLGYRIRKFVQEFKPRVVKLILDFIDDGLLFGDLKYDPKQKIGLDRFFQSSIFVTRPAVYDGEDFIEGRIGDIEFEMCELNVKEFSKVRERLDPVFRGIFIRAKTFHPLKGAMLVVPRSTLPDLSESVKNFVRNGGQIMDGFIRHEKFREAFTTYGSKNTKVTDVLPDELMDFMLNYLQRRGNIFFSFFGRNIYAAIANNKDILEPKWFSSNVSFELVREFYEDINLALFVVTAIDRSH